MGQAVELSSGPGGLISFVRRGMFGDTRLGGPSLPIDIGGTTTAWNKDHSKTLHGHAHRDRC